MKKCTSILRHFFSQDFNKNPAEVFLQWGLCWERNKYTYVQSGERLVFLARTLASIRVAHRATNERSGVLCECVRGRRINFSKLFAVAVAGRSLL